MAKPAKTPILEVDLSGVPFPDLVAEMIRRLGDDPEREGMRRTPERVAEAMAFLTKGYAEKPEAVLSDALFAESHRNMVVVKDIEIYSLCEHHLLPFFGKAHVAYVPNGRIVGLSKLARLVEVFARRFQVQEKMTAQIAGCIQRALAPRGVGVVVEGAHECMTTRGIHKRGVSMVTSKMLGSFRDDARTRAEFLQFIDVGPGR